MADALTPQEWKEGLAKDCELVEQQYRQLAARINSLDEVDYSSCDIDELAAFMQVKLLKMNKNIQTIVDQ